MTNKLYHADPLANSLKALAVPGPTESRLRIWSGEVQ
jgi:hypothetical protein